MLLVLLVAEIRSPRVMFTGVSSNDQGHRGRQVTFGISFVFAVGVTDCCAERRQVPRAKNDSGQHSFRVIISPPRAHAISMSRSTSNRESDCWTEERHRVTLGRTWVWPYSSKPFIWEQRCRALDEILRLYEPCPNNPITTRCDRELPT